MKIRRRGRHTTPSQVEKVAAQAGKAAPAVAIAGALVAVPAAQQGPAATSSAAATAGASPAAHQAPQAAALDSFSRNTSGITHSTARATPNVNREYTVRSGDTLSLVAQRFYHVAADWQWLYHENARAISDPNVIYVGQRLSVPLHAPAHFTLPGHQPRHAKQTGGTTTGGTTTTAAHGSRRGGAGSAAPSRSSGASGTGGTTDNAGSTRSVGGGSTPAGDYSCSQLEGLWDSAGGNPSAAFTAAEIAMAESGGNPNALSPTDDFGLWQINASNGALATFNPFQNARSAIALSGDGGNWNAWTTFTSGAYHGRC
jgi:LysM repeat protein